MRYTFDTVRFAQHIEVLAKAKGLNMAEVSAITGVSETTLSRMKHRREPSLCGAAALSKWSGLNLSDYSNWTHPHKQDVYLATTPTIKNKVIVTFQHDIENGWYNADFPPPFAAYSGNYRSNKRIEELARASFLEIEYQGDPRYNPWRTK